MQVRVWPSTVQVIVVVPGPAGFTTPSAEMVATAVLPMDQRGVEEVPFTFICTEGLLRPFSRELSHPQLSHRCVLHP